MKNLKVPGLPDAKVNALMIEYVQPADSCQEDRYSQVLKVSTGDAGGGPFIILETERWAIDDIEAFYKTLKRIQKSVREVPE